MSWRVEALVPRDSLFKDYLRELANIAQRGDAREESFYPALKDLVEKIARELGHASVQVTPQPRPTEAGNPDFRVWDGQDRVIGYIEAKPPERDLLDPVEGSEQLRRYRETFPNLILTNFLEFRLYRDGHRVDAALLGRPVVLSRLRATPPVENGEAVRALLDRFLEYSLPRTFDAETLASELAKRTRFLRDVVLQELRREQAQGSGTLLGFFDAFQHFLIGSLDEPAFADLYAQTITYGLFAARTRTDNGFNRRRAFDSIPRTIGVLRDLFRYTSLGDMPAELEWIVDDIAHVLAVADARALLHQYFYERKGSDPIVHFYETFLAHYDPAERERRGVYYTPEPVVDYIVRGLHQILKESFGKTDGLASRDVTLLDPAAGTMTFVAQAAERAVREFESKYGGGAREAFIREHVIGHFYAFELMMAPYAVGHLKMGFYLEELGHRLAENERLPFYLTNTLDTSELQQSKLPGLSSLAEESRLAGRVKREQPILVILGNPPYSGHSANQGEWIRGLIEDYKQVDGQPLGEKNPKWLQDDYVKFLRFAEWKIAQAGRGVVGMITNHSYLDNPTFRGMRRHLMRTFDDIYVLDLHGNSLKKETCPDGSPDENVFDIRQGVAIAFFVKLGRANGTSSVHHAELFGRRETKYAWLRARSFADTPWQAIAPRSPFYLFVPRDEATLARYQDFPRITDIFPVSSVGIVTARDHLTIHWTPEEVWTTVLAFSRMDPELARQAYDLGGDAQDWKIALAQEDLRDSGPDRGCIAPILYRPFDVRYTYYTGRSRGFICRPRPEVMRHMLGHGNVALVVPRQHKDEFGSLVTATIGTHKTVAAYDINYYFPLYLHSGVNDASAPLQADMFRPSQSGRRPNLSRELLRQLASQYGREPAPEEIFHYVYAVLYTPAYRQRYAEFLRTDFPRVPFPQDESVLREMAALGERLVKLHLLDASELDPPMARFEGQGDNRIGRGKRGVRYDPDAQRVYINDVQHFAPVPQHVWEYHIGAYQVCEKWLKDRQERTLSLDEIQTYQRILTALDRTVEVQRRLDQVYEGVEPKPSTL